MDKRLLILDDDLNLRGILADEFTDRGYKVTQAETIQAIKEHVFDFAILDLRLVGEYGLQAIEFLLNENKDCRIVILTGYGSVATAVEAMKLGALNYLNKPASVDQIEAALLDSLKSSTQNTEQVKSLNQNEHEYIEFILAQNDGNISKTAKQLGLHRQSLQRKLKKFPG